VAGGDLPAYATDLSLARRDDIPLMTRLRQINKGVL